MILQNKKRITWKRHVLCVLLCIRDLENIAYPVVLNTAREFLVEIFQDILMSFQNMHCLHFVTVYNYSIINSQNHIVFFVVKRNCSKTRLGWKKGLHAEVTAGLIVEIVVVILQKCGIVEYNKTARHRLGRPESTDACWVASFVNCAKVKVTACCGWHVYIWRKQHLKGTYLAVYVV